MKVSPNWVTVILNYSDSHARFVAASERAGGCDQWCDASDRTVCATLFVLARVAVTAAIPSHSRYCI